ncbi:hypothetical protein BX616_001247 [Lobosporangium transversale]|nr:hypothetical protein BX616_001247 [Lobosporangium transversale]
MSINDPTNLHGYLTFWVGGRDWQNGLCAPRRKMLLVTYCIQTFSVLVMSTLSAPLAFAFKPAPYGAIYMSINDPVQAFAFLDRGLSYTMVKGGIDVGDWRNGFNQARVGAGYFLSQQGRLKFTPEGYIGFRALRRQDSTKLLQEWDRWIRDLRCSPFEHVKKAANLASAMCIKHLDDYYRDRVISESEIISLENASEKLADSEQELILLSRERREKRNSQEVDSIQYSTIKAGYLGNTTGETSSLLSEDDVAQRTSPVREVEEDKVNRKYTPPPQVPHVMADVKFEGSEFWRMIGMASTWTTEGVDMLMSFDDAREAVLALLPDITLCQDNVADFCYDSELQDLMDDEAFGLALDSLPTMPCLPVEQLELLHHVFGGDNSWEGISDRVDDLMKVPSPVPALNRYIFTAFHPFRAAFADRGAISASINERQYFRDYVVELLRGALSVYGIPYAWGEVYVPAVAFRKGNESTGTGRGKFADGVSEVAGHQIFLSESSQLHRANTSKEQGDKLKLKRMLRDLFNYTVLEMTRNKDKVSPRLTVFGSRTFRDTTELIAMDYEGVYRAYCLGSFKVVTEAGDAKKLLECFEMCLRFALTVKTQVDERSGAGRLSDTEALKLTKAARRLLIPTTITPTKQQQQQRLQQQQQHLQQEHQQPQQRYQHQQQYQKRLQQQQQQQQPLLKRRR